MDKNIELEFDAAMAVHQINVLPSYKWGVLCNYSELKQMTTLIHTLDIEEEPAAVFLPHAITRTINKK